MTTSVEKWVRQIEKAIPIAAADDTDASWAIVEPWVKTDLGSQLPEAIEYATFLDNHPEQWAGFIRSTFGGYWGDQADRVAEEGY